MIETVPNIHVKTGRQLTPSGEEFTGISVRIGEITDPATVQRTYDDIEKIFKSNQANFVVHEMDTPAGHFKSYTVSTS